MMLAALALAAALAPIPQPKPGTAHDPAIPTLEQVAGHALGAEITSPEGIAAYLGALAKAAPERARLIEYARSWEGRPLNVLVIGAPERIARLDALQADLQRLADPRTLSAGDADRLVRELPVVTWLQHAVHGNEISSCEAALATAYHLLAARGDADVERVLSESLVLIDPLQNPDGRARFLAQFGLGRAMQPDPEPLSIEHDEPWPGGRSNHYLFDLNRDWFALTQPETRGRVALYRRFFPQVTVDLHEMGGESTYYFAPPADPLNPHISAGQREWLKRFGQALGHDFDAHGFPYFVREVYDSFYPGYGESWPIFQGAVGMTFEQASARGLAYRRQDETLLTYAQGVLHHFTAALRTLVTAAENRERLLRDFLEYRRAAVRDGERGPVREYLLPPGADPSRAARLAELLVEQGIDVRRADEPLQVGSRTLPAGTYVVPAAQPAGYLVRNLLDPQVPMDAAFVQEQDRRRRKRLSDQIYDVTAWSLPLAFDVECVTAERATAARSVPVVRGGAAAPAGVAEARVGYLVPWGSAAAALVGDALRAGLKVRTADQPFTLAGRKYAAGTALLRVSENAAGLRGALTGLAERHRAEIVPIDTSWPDEGIALGSNQVRALRAPRVALGWDVPAQSLSAGWARYVLERRFGQPVTAVRVASLRRLDLERYDVLVLPAGDYGDALGEEAVKRLEDWAQRGGTLIVLGEAARWAAREKVGLLSTTTLLRDGRPEVERSPEAKEKDKPAAKDPPKEPFDLEKAIQPEEERPEETFGALLRVTLDAEHWLSAGTDGEIQALVEGRRVFTPLKLDKGRNVGVYAKDQTVAAGLVWDEARALLAQKAYLMYQPLGDGHVVAFAEDPNYRGYAEATELLFLNAVLLVPAH